ncbi:hypothetical protein D3C84_1030650 [compost metagenome]
MANGGYRFVLAQQRADEGNGVGVGAKIPQWAVATGIDNCGNLLAVDIRQFHGAFQGIVQLLVAYKASVRFAVFDRLHRSRVDRRLPAFRRGQHDGEPGIDELEVRDKELF